MSTKKRKRQLRSATPPASAAPVEAKAASTSGGFFRQAREEFNPDYTYVIKDLRRIGALAGSFLVILVILSFFLR
jgi:hypothetical protein